MGTNDTTLLSAERVLLCICIDTVQSIRVYALKYTKQNDRLCNEDKAALCYGIEPLLYRGEFAEGAEDGSAVSVTPVYKYLAVLV